MPISKFIPELQYNKHKGTQPCQNPQLLMYTQDSKQTKGGVWCLQGHRLDKNPRGNQFMRLMIANWRGQTDMYDSYNQELIWIITFSRQ